MNTLERLKECLLCFHVKELRELASSLDLSEKGNKITVIQRILHYLETGEELALPKFPAASLARRGERPPLEPESEMLKGSYKNDYETRLFFQSLIGDHFHFTAYGIDWLNERWLKGDPPTYLEFAKMWQEEHLKRLKNPAPPKQEWAYIRFAQDFMTRNPDSSRATLQEDWENERSARKKEADKILSSFR